MVTSEAAAEEAHKRGIPIITLTQKLGIPDLGDYVFRNFLTPEMQIESILSCATNEFGATRFAILYPEDKYGQTLTNLFQDQAKYYGAKVVGIASYQPEQTEFSESIKKLVNIKEDDEKSIIEPHRLSKSNRSKVQKTLDLNFDAFFIPDKPEKVSLIAPQLAYWDVNDVLLLGTNLWHSEQLIEFSGDCVQYAVLSEVFITQSSKKIVKSFVQFFETVYDSKLGFIEALAYDTAMIALHTAINPDVQSRNDFRDKLADIRDFQGVTGLTSNEAPRSRAARNSSD